MVHFEIFKDKKGQYRWRLRANNNKIIADSAESYVNKTACKHGIELVKKHSRQAKLADTTTRLQKQKRQAR